MIVRTSDGKIVPVIGMIGGTKSEPRKVPFGAVQEDNVNAEFNIDPAGNQADFVHNLKSVMRTLEGMLPVGHQVLVKSSHEYEQDVLLNAGPSALEFGCDPDMNSLTREFNDSPNPFTTLRTAGAHVHIGWDDADCDHTKYNVSNMCDLLLGLWSVNIDRDVRRRSMYGKAGASRLKEYGVEYRTLSNFWLKDEDKMREVYDRSVLAAQNVEHLQELRQVVDGETVQAVINASDRTSARHYLRLIERKLGM
jgi:hypothetical protein